MELNLYAGSSMERFLGRFAPHTFAILRFIAGVMFMLHGTQKLFSFPKEGPPQLPPLMLAAGWIEVVCGILIAIGLLGGWAAFLASGEMAVAYFMVHAKRGFWPTVNEGENAVLYCFLFLFIAAHGSGILSIDSLLRRGRTSSRA
jgi:putative oxidoreductase